MDFKGSGDRKRERERREPEGEDARAAAILKKLEKIKKRRGNIYGDFLIKGGPGSFTFKNSGSRFNVYLEMLKGSRTAVSMDRRRIYIGSEGAHPLSNPFTLYREKTPPDQETVDKYKKD